MDAGESLGAQVGCMLGFRSSQVLLGGWWQVRLGAGDDQHLFDAVQIDGWMHNDGGVGLVVGVGRDALDGAHGQSARIDLDRKSTRLNSSHLGISYAGFCLKKK